MAGVDSSICFTWGHYFVGREQKGMECFVNAIAYFAGKKTHSLISNYVVGVASQGNFTNFAGYLVAEGTAAQIDNILKEEIPSPGITHSFQELVSIARHCVFNFSVVRCDAGGDINPDSTPPPASRSRRRKKFDETGAKLGY